MLPGHPGLGKSEPVGIAAIESHPKGVSSSVHVGYAVPVDGPASGAPEQDGAPVVLVGIQPHTCAPVLSSGGRGGGGLPLGLTFSDATSNCLSFSSPAAGDAQQVEPDSMSPEELAAIAADRAMALARRPDLRTAPRGVGLTGLPSFFWLAVEPEPVSATAVAPGLTVTAEAYPVSYLWSFGDGTEISTEHPGRPWRKGQRGNISHMYESRGSYDLRVRVVWEARWRIDSGPWRPLGYFSNEDSERYPVRQVRSRLTRTRR